MPGGRKENALSYGGKPARFLKTHSEENAQKADVQDGVEIVRTCSVGYTSSGNNWKTAQKKKKRDCRRRNPGPKREQSETIGESRKISKNRSPNLVFTQL